MKKLLFFIAISTFILGSFCIYKGFDKKENYDNPEYSWQDSTNAYVGGDAYNYIINSNYYTGYNVLGIGCYIITVLSLIGSAILMKQDSYEAQSKHFYEYIYTHPIFQQSNKMGNNNTKNYGLSVNDLEQSTKVDHLSSEKKGQNLAVNHSLSNSNSTPSLSANSYYQHQAPVSPYYSAYNQQIPLDQWSPQITPLQNNQPSAVNYSSQTFVQNSKSDNNSEHKTSNYPQSS